MKAEQNELTNRIGPGTTCGAVMRHYWQPVALVDEVNTALGIELPTDQVDTVGGFVTSLLGHVPVQGDRASYDGVEFMVERVDGHRIAQVRIGANHFLYDTPGNCLKKRFVQAEVFPIADSSSHYSPQHVAPTFIGGKHTVGNQESRGPCMIGYYPHRRIILRIAAVDFCGEFF